jgi:hypothetical protein
MSDVTVNKKRCVQVIEIATGKVVHEVDVRDMSDRQIERVMSGMLINMDTERFHLKEVP